MPYLSDIERRLYRFVMRVGEENNVRRALGAHPATVGEGDAAVTLTSFLRGSVVFLIMEGRGDPLASLRNDSRGAKLLDVLAKHAAFDPEHPEDARIPSFAPGEGRVQEARAA